MSKGYGAIQRQVLALLNDQRGVYVTVFELAEAMTPAAQRHLDVALIESIRRAVKKLAAEGVIDLDTIPVDRYGTTKQMLAARLETTK